MESIIVTIIQAMLAPAVMISACGLLLLGTNNKYALIVNRIRLLDEEKRKLKIAGKTEPLTEDQLHRLWNVELQIEKISFRIKLVQNAVFSYTLGVIFFIAASLIIGIQYFIPTSFITGLSGLAFLVGMLSVMVGVLFAAREVRKGYEIIQLEITEIE